MCRCKDSTLDDYQKQQLLFMKDSYGFRTVVLEAVWHFVSIDPIEMQEQRDDELAFCGRQGRQSVIELEKLSLVRFHEICRAFNRQIRYENEASERARQEMNMR